MLLLESFLLTTYEFSDLPPLICSSTSDFFDCLAFISARIFRAVVTIAFILSIFFIAWGGMEYILYGADKEKRKIASRRLIWSVIGLIIALLSFAFVYFLHNIIKEGKISLIYQIFVHAEEIEISIPEELECGGNVTLKSILSSDNNSSGYSTQCLIYYLVKFIKLLYIGALTIGIFFLAWAGILYTTKSKKVEEIHPKLIYGIIGILLAIFSFTIIAIIGLFFENLKK
jgi:hypothetical protein